jgi:hypothetical protein
MRKEMDKKETEGKEGNNAMKKIRIGLGIKEDW